MQNLTRITAASALSLLTIGGGAAAANAAPAIPVDNGQELTERSAGCTLVAITHAFVIGAFVGLVLEASSGNRRSRA